MEDPDASVKLPRALSGLRKQMSLGHPDGHDEVKNQQTKASAVKQTFLLFIFC